MQQSLAEKIQSFLSNGLSSFGTLLKILLRSKYFIRLPKAEDTECIIMGNGPSTKEMVSKHQEVLKRKTLWAVNYFGSSDLFEAVQPNYYLIVGPEFWREGVRKKNIELRKILFDRMLTKTTWPMTVFLPSEAFKSKFLKQYLNKNPNLKFHPFNSTPVEGFQWLNHLLFSWNLGMPRPHNVLIPSIMLAINMGFKKIYILGSEHSWLPTISVNENNEVLFRNRHFYDKKEIKNHKMYFQGIRSRRLHEILYKFMLTFKGYFVLQDYANVKGIKIYNTTPESFIDAFERKNVKDILS
jgi:hypothetical protein